MVIEMKTKSSIKQTVLETFEDLYEADGVDELTIREIRALCLPKPTEYKPQKIVSIRRKNKLSQAAFAMVLNTSPSTVQKWERGVKKPSGPAVKLLSIVEKKGIKAVI